MAFAQGWRRIMEAVAADPVSAARTVFDILNEPDVHGLRWEAHTSATGYHMPSVADVYHQILAMGHTINPGAVPRLAHVLTAPQLQRRPRVPLAGHRSAEKHEAH